MRARVHGPETRMARVAGGDFSDLTWPILVAAKSRHQLDEFIYQNGLLCCEVRRFLGRPDFFERSAPDKILLLLPDCQADPATKVLVRWWVEDLDRYTVQIDSLNPWLMGRAGVCVRLGGLVMALLAMLLLWLVVRW